MALVTTCSGGDGTTGSVIANSVRSFLTYSSLNKLVIALLRVGG